MNIKSGLLLYLLSIVILNVLNVVNGKEKSISLRSNMLTVPDSTEDPDPPLFFKDGSGKVQSTTDLKGKVVFINFWATWCAPCIKEMPTLDTLKRKFDGNDDIVFLMVDVDENYQQAQAFMDQRDLQLPVYTPHGEIPALYLSRGIPTTIILNKQGEIVSRIEGGRDYTAPRFERALREWIQEEGGR